MIDINTGEEIPEKTLVGKDDDDGGGIIPGFGAASVVGAAVIYCGYYARKRR